ncbi:MAG: hypothetical protein JXB47_10270 [Anaerolineae bacterium]|nr:hypothetical protein [Anaerolineae bacterium]
MGKKREARKGLENVFFSRTEPEAGAALEPGTEDKTKDKSVSRGIAMRQSEWDALAAIAEANGISRNALIRYALVHFVAEYEAGGAKIEFEDVRQLKLP